MFVFGKSRRLELSTQANSLQDAIFVFEGDFSVQDDKKKVVDTITKKGDNVVNKGEAAVKNGIGKVEHWFGD